MTTQETAGPPPERAAPLEVPQRALDVDLAQAFSQLLFRASLLQRLRDEEARAARSGQRDLLGLLVDVDDALAALGLDPDLVRLGRSSGIEATRRRLLGKLAKAGVRPMRLDGLPADPVLSEIVGTEVRAGLEPETVVQSVVTGFFWNDEVLRRAQVVVATPPAADPPADPRVDPRTDPRTDLAADPAVPEGLSVPARPPAAPAPDAPAADPAVPEAAAPEAAVPARPRKGGPARSTRRRRRKS
ncbi:nucleotide exchange factor GrpE [Kitasatospora sp. NBC_01539]|uniref:nucleotide exchange factor GrpE n=1 Tax=Kitasatospora sp. NBC_01539 TaxID=2903577 RepID=UPI0038600D08